jgi:hypothetical protein
MKGNFVVIDADSVKQRHVIMILGKSAGFRVGVIDEQELLHSGGEIIFMTTIIVNREHYSQTATRGWRIFTYERAIEELEKYIKES